MCRTRQKDCLLFYYNRKRSLDCKRPPSVLTFKYQQILSARAGLCAPRWPFPPTPDRLLLNRSASWCGVSSDEVKSAPSDLSSSVPAEHIGTSWQICATGIFFRSDSCINVHTGWIMRLIVGGGHNIPANVTPQPQANRPREDAPLSQAPPPWPFFTVVAMCWRRTATQKVKSTSSRRRQDLGVRVSQTSFCYRSQ